MKMSREVVGVRARALDVGLFSCAGRAATRRRMPKHTTTTSLLIFMRCFYQKNLDVCRKMFARTKRTGRDETAQAVTNRFTILPCRFHFLSSNGGFSMGRVRLLWLVALVCSFFFSTTVPCARAQTASASLGVFDSHSDVGTLLHAGSVEYDSSKQTYTVTGSGENMWSAADAFQFAWKKVSGDVTLTADIAFVGAGGNEHKKAVLIFRQSLDADSVYADVALHASGLTSLQFRDEKGAVTHEIQSNISAPKRLRLAKRGDYVYMSLAEAGAEPKVAGGWLRIPLQGAFYVGIGVCSHDKDAVEKAIFSNVKLAMPSSAQAGQSALYSTIETIAIDSADRRVEYLAPGRFEAPNWMRDGSTFLFNRDGHIERLLLSSGKPEVIDTGFANRCNNDHGISPDATQLAISDNSQEEHRSVVYIVPIGGGTPRRITQKSPSYWHGWSPDGRMLAFVGERNGEFDIYTIPASGGEG